MRFINPSLTIAWSRSVALRPTIIGLAGAVLGAGDGDAGGGSEWGCNTFEKSRAI
jgi:hypothetical protein